MVSGHPENEIAGQRIGTIDLTPTPRVLRMLGNIEFDNWQCLAELIDNSIDALLTQGGGNIGISTPSIREFDNDPGASIRAWDDGPGMSEDQLENALKAGYSGNQNDPLDHLGLFGMGFNIATARLGKKTQVKTTRKGDKNWYSVIIDFSEMEKQGSFVRDVFAIEKDNPEIHGTEIIITNLDDRARTIRQQKTIEKKLSRIYSPILQKGNIVISINDKELASRGLCVWSGERYVTRDGERIPARIDIEKNFGKKYFCSDCWSWIEDYPVQEDINEIMCPYCNSNKGVHPKEMKLTGWIGVQRYYDLEHYGIDLIRNGRVIEPLSKELFFWRHPQTGEKVKEYVLDATFLGGRIVGELNIDFVPVTYMKDHFEKADKRWKLVSNYIRGEGPLRRKHANTHGYPENKSPLGLIYKGFRKANDPGKGDLLPGDTSDPSKIKAYNEPLKNWAEKFYNGDPDYQDDSKWWGLVEQTEMAKRKSGDGRPFLPKPGGDSSEEPQLEDSTTTSSSGEERIFELKIEKDPLLSQEYDLEELKERSINVEVNRLIKGDLDYLPITFEVKNVNQVDIVYDPNHPVFNAFNIQPLDLILLELSQMWSRRLDNPKEWPPSRIYCLLKEKYSSDKVLSPNELSERARNLIKEIKYFFASLNVNIDPDTVFENIVSEVRKNVFNRLGEGEEKVKKLLSSPEYIKFAPDGEILSVFQKNPNQFLDGKFWNRAYTELGTDELQYDMIRTFSGYISDILWLKNEAKDYDPDAIPIDVKYRLQRAAFSLKLLEVYRE